MRRRGFSQLEVVIALAVLSIGLLAVYAVLSFILRGGRHAAQVMEATEFAQRLVLLVRVRNLIPWNDFTERPETGLFDAPGARPLLNAPPFDADFPAGTSYTRNIHLRRLSGTSTNPDFHVAEIAVSVFWRGRDGEHQVTIVAAQREP